ncbi:ThiF family adenylyltransferase [Paenibacillus sp. FSL K6-1096]|uniref:HesA/MoeB/ThiF family protein n=1 Tax=Paenibacillus sp. FSL K6-1096 TaxID=2921460 RepID=UPI0030ED10DC
MTIHSETDLTQDELARYRRQLILPEIGPEGQKRLKQAKVLVIGAGGIGSPLLLYLAAAGIGHISIYDHDVLELTNMNRQIIHDSANAGVPKVQSAEQTLKRLNPELTYELHAERLTRETALVVVPQYDIVVNAVDNLDTRYMLNDVCVELRKPLVEGSIFHFEGQVMFISPDEDSACYRCVYPEPLEPPKKQEFGVIGVTPGIVGTLQAAEVIKYVAGIGKSLKNRMIYFDLLSAKVREIELKPDPECPVCSQVKQKAVLR